MLFKNSNNFSEKYILDIFLCLLLAAIQWRFTIEILSTTNFIDSVKTSLGVVDGRPHWEVFQSRILGPWTVYLLGKAINDFGYASSIFTFLGYALSNYIFLWAIRPLKFNNFFSLILFNFIIVFFIDDMWLISWDIYSLIFFTIFLGLVIRESKFIYFFLLYILMLLNRESVHFISLFIIFKSMDKFIFNFYKSYKFDFNLIKIFNFLIGLIMFFGGIFIIYKIRKVLLVEEVGPMMFNLPQLADKTLHFHFFENINFIRHSILLSNSGINISLIFIYFIYFILIFYSFLKLEFEKFFMYTFINALMLVAILIFAVFNETRVYFETIPFLAFILIHFFSNKVIK